MVTSKTQERGPWEAAIRQLEEWDPAFAQTCVKMTTSPWTRGILPRKFLELVSLAVNVSCTNLNAEGTRRHVRAALEAGATRDEILIIFKMATVTAIHTCSLGAPILQEEAKSAGVPTGPSPPPPTPFADKMRAIGQWNHDWDPFFELDPEWTDQMMANGASIYGAGIMPPKLI